MLHEFRINVIKNSELNGLSPKKDRALYMEPAAFMPTSANFKSVIVKKNKLTNGVEVSVSYPVTK